MKKLTLINLQAHVKHNTGHFSSCKNISFLIMTLESCERSFFLTEDRKIKLRKARGLQNDFKRNSMWQNWYLNICA